MVEDMNFAMSTFLMRQCSIDDMRDLFPLADLLALTSHWLTPLSWTPVGK